MQLRRPLQDCVETAGQPEANIRVNQQAGKCPVHHCTAHHTEVYQGGQLYALTVRNCLTQATTADSLIQRMQLATLFAHGGTPHLRPKCVWQQMKGHNRPANVAVCDCHGEPAPNCPTCCCTEKGALGRPCRYAANFYGHVYLTTLLLQRLMQSEPSRWV